MSLETFERALNWGDEYICIGGGEPTLHKEFEKMLLMAIAHPDVEQAAVITNGTHVRRAELIAGLNDKGLIFGEMSSDSYHDNGMVKEEVLSAFHYKVRNTERHLIRVGRAKTVLDEGCTVTCIGEDPHVLPSGDITQCGCPGAPIVGNVYSGYESYYEPGCYRMPGQEEEEEQAA
jgi:organic radical activating enzyme